MSDAFLGIRLNWVAGLREEEPRGEVPLPSRPVREHGPCDSSRSKMTLVAWLWSCFRVSPRRGHPLSAFPCCSAASGLTSRLTCPLADKPCGRDVRLPRRVTAQGQASSPPLRASPRTIRALEHFPMWSERVPSVSWLLASDSEAGMQSLVAPQSQGDPPALQSLRIRNKALFP